MNMRIVSVVVPVAALLTCASMSQAEKKKESPHLWDPKVSSVTVFKNGLGFFQREGQVKLRDGWCVSDAVPPATFGTLAIYSHSEAETVDIVGTGPGEIVEFDGVDAADDLESKRNLLESYKHLKLQLSYRQQGADRTAVGRLVSLGADYAILQADNNSFAVPVEDIYQLQVLENPLRVHVASEESEAPTEAHLGMAYLRKGITWIPEYTLELIDEDTAELTLRGTLVNEAEDLVHCDVNLVVGVPHFIHTDYLAPSAAGQVIRTIGASVAPSAVMSQMMNNAICYNGNSADLINVIDRPVQVDGRPIQHSTGNLPTWEGAGASDFTVYTRKDLTLRRGEKAIVTLFVKKIKYGHMYRWSPPGKIRHLLTLVNETGTPWTTGPCLAVSEGNALSEDLLKYVPRNGTGEFPVTTAINITHKHQEKEAARKFKAHQPASNYYMDLVTLTGELSLRNYDQTPAELIIDLPLPGKPVEASDEGRMQLDTTHLKLQERKGSVSWRVMLAPGEEKTITYAYERYVPSH